MSIEVIITVSMFAFTLIGGIGGITWKLSKYDSKVTGIGNEMDVLKGTDRGCGAQEVHKEKIENLEKKVIDLEKDRNDVAIWRGVVDIKLESMNMKLDDVKGSLSKLVDKLGG